MPIDFCNDNKPRPAGQFRYTMHKEELFEGPRLPPARPPARPSTLHAFPGR